tara:strand:+ start:36 stop:560 length:525 start_codon:yes stop_codon:yes gene_type:complete
MRNMTKTKRYKNEGKTAFAARVVTQYGDYISAKDAWERLVNKRGVGVKDWQRFQSNLSDAVRMGLLDKKRGEDMKGNRRVLYGPDEFREAVIKTIFAAPLTEEGIVMDKVQRPNRPSINDIPLGDILSYNHVERDDIMSVIEDLLYDTPLGELRQRYPTLEDLAWSVALDGGEQ